MKLSLFALVCFCLTALVQRGSSKVVYKLDSQDDGVYEVSSLEQLNPQSFTPKVRNKRTISSIGNLLAVNLFPVPILPTNFIGLQVTIVPPKNRNSRRRG